MKETNQSLKKRQEGHYWSNFGRVRFISHLSGHFFQHLTLPERFVQYLRKKLPTIVVLKGPGGFGWNVGLKSCKDGTLLFKDGWEEFVKDHSLERNDELLFEYNTEESCFDVKIFVSSSQWCEKEASYLIKLCEHCQTNGKMKEKQPVENRTHVTPDAECNSPASDNATSDDTEPFNIDDEEEAVTTSAFNENGLEQADNNEQGHPHSTNPEAGQRTWGRSRRTRFVSHRRLVAEEESNPALRRTYAAKSPRGLVVSMQSRVVQNRHRVPIPRQWFVNFISKRISHKVILRVKNEERTWVVPVYFRESETGRTRPVELKPSGWKPFAADNCIKEFDACLFEPAGRYHLGIPIIDVVIERHDPIMPILPPCTDADAGKSREEKRHREISLKAIDTENNIAFQQARAEEIPGISKVVVIRMTHVSRSFRVRMCLEWISKHLSEQSIGARKVLSSMDMQMQQVVLHFNETYKYAELAAGWKEFACYHSLNVYDVCLFNPAGTRNNDGISIINVRIFRNGTEGQNPWGVNAVRASLFEVCLLVFVTNLANGFFVTGCF